MPQFDNRNLKASHGLYKHDLSYRNTFSSPYGALLPFCVYDVVGNSKVELSLEHQTRALPLNSASFIRLREHFDYFFVPYAQLYRQYDNFKTMQSNQVSTLDKSVFPNMVTSLPTFTAASLQSVLTPSQTDDYNDAAGYNSIYGSRRLFDLLGYGNYPMSPNINDIPSLQFNPFRLLAYQKIYSDYYRNDKYEGNQTEFYNIDNLASNGNILSTLLKDISLIRYRWRRKDYFMQVTPDLLPTANQFNRDGWNSLLNTANNISVISSQFTAPDAGVIGSSHQIQTGNAATGISNPDNTSTNILSYEGAQVRTPNYVTNNLSNQSSIQHRLIESRQKLLERMYAANSDFSSQMLAIYGYSPKEGRHGKVKHINGFSEILSVSDVNNQTDTYAQGQGFYGKINNYGSSKKIRFDVPEDGIIMGIYSTECMPDYVSNRVDRFNFKHVPEDYFNPYYEGLGKQALFGIEYCTFMTNSSGVKVRAANNILGFIPRYGEYKDKVDEVHGELSEGGVYENYCAPVNTDIRALHPYLSLEYMICKPAQLDKLFFTTYDGTEKTDQFLNNFYNECKVLAPIKRNSEL